MKKKRRQLLRRQLKKLRPLLMKRLVRKFRSLRKPLLKRSLRKLLNKRSLKAGSTGCLDGRNDFIDDFNFRSDYCYLSCSTK